MPHWGKNKEIQCSQLLKYLRGSDTRFVFKQGASGMYNTAVLVNM